MKGLKKVLMNRISLEGQWLGLSAFTDEDVSSILRELRFHMPCQVAHHPSKKIFLIYKF